MRTRALWLLITATALSGLATQAVNLHALASLTDRGISAGQTAGVATFFLVVAGVATIVWGFLVERIHVRYVASLIFLAGAAAMVAIILADTLPMAYVYGLLYGIALGGLHFQTQIIYADYFGRASQGAIRGFVQPFMMASSAGGPILASLAFDIRGSYFVAFIAFLVSYLLAAMAILLAHPPQKQPAYQQT